MVNIRKERKNSTNFLKGNIEVGGERATSKTILLPERDDPSTYANGKREKGKGGGICINRMASRETSVGRVKPRTGF